MNTATIKDKHLKLDQAKIDRAKRILGVKTETEAIEKALEMVIKKTDETGKPELKWAGTLKNLKKKYTSVQLQHELPDLRLGKK